MNKAFVTLASKDDENFPVVQVEYMGNPTDIEMLFPYGFSANVPVDSVGVFFNIGGGNKAGIFNHPTKRFKGLKEWEVQIGNYQTQSSIKFPEDESVLLESKGLINIESEGGNTVLDVKSNKVQIKGDSAELLDLLDKTIAELDVIMTQLLNAALIIDPVSGPLPINPALATIITASQATLGTVKTSLGTIKV